MQYSGLRDGLFPLLQSHFREELLNPGIGDILH
jgi:hypothetical protein